MIVKYLILLSFICIMGCTKHDPCDDIDDSTRDGRIEKAICQIGEYVEKNKTK